MPNFELDTIIGHKIPLPSCDQVKMQLA